MENQQKRGMSVEQAQALAQRTPAPVLDAPENSAPKSGAAAKGSAAPSAAPTQGQQETEKLRERSKKEERGQLPGEIVRQFAHTGVDLSAVPVIRNSHRAQEEGVAGFATASEIHLAPGADEKRVLAHEAAHVVQFRKGKSGQKHDSEAENESKASEAEEGGQPELGAADPHAKRNKVEAPEGATIPQCDFTWGETGLHFSGASGTIAEKELAKANWDERRLFRVQNFWPIPAFPVAGLSVMAEAVFAPEALVKMGAAWKYDHDAHEISVTGSITGSLSAALIARVRAGAALNVVVAEGGVGLEASAALKVEAAVTKSIAFAIDTKTGDIKLTLTPLDLDIGATLKAALSLVAWVDTWWSSNVKRWTFANFNIGGFQGYKLPIGIEFGTAHGVRLQPHEVQPGHFYWGSPPEPK